MQLCYWAPTEAAPLLFFYEHVNQFKSFSRCSCSVVSGLNGKYQWAMRKGCSLLLGSQQWLNYSPLEMVCFCHLDSSLLRSCSLQVVTVWEKSLTSGFHRRDFASASTAGSCTGGRCCRLLSRAFFLSFHLCSLVNCKYIAFPLEQNKTNRSMISCFSCHDIIAVPGTFLFLVETQTVPMVLLFQASVR